MEEWQNRPRPAALSRARASRVALFFFHAIRRLNAQESESFDREHYRFKPRLILWRNNSIVLLGMDDNAQPVYRWGTGSQLCTLANLWETDLYGGQSPVGESVDECLQYI